MKFKVYRDVDSKRLRKIVVELQDSEGKTLDKTYMFGYALPLVGLGLRIKMRQKKMLRLQAIMQAHSN